MDVVLIIAGLLLLVVGARGQVGVRDRGLVALAEGDDAGPVGEREVLGLVVPGRPQRREHRRAEHHHHRPQRDVDGRPLAEPGEKPEQMRHALWNIEQITSDKNPIRLQRFHGPDDLLMARLIAIQV